MRHDRLAIITVATLLGIGSVTSAGRPRTFEYSWIEVEDALTTTAFGINAGGDIVGSYVDSDGAVHGYRLRGGAFTTIDFPGAAGSLARGIGPGGDIVGGYWLPGEPAPNEHGFLLTRQGVFLPVDVPGHISTIAQRILPDGTILGCRHDTDTMHTMRGVVISGAGVEEIAAHASMHNGATPDMRRIAGLFTNMATGRTEGYLVDDGVFTPFVVPGSLMTAAWDVNPLGEVVGVYRDAAGFHGFVLGSDGYSFLDVPGAAATRAFGTNSRGDVVGTFVLGGKTRGFLARRTVP